MKIVFAICLMSSSLVLRADPPKRDAPQTEELAVAVAVATAKLQATVTSPADYKLIGVELAWVKGEEVWRTTYKLSRLLPKNPEELIGAGGEVFINVDLKKAQATVRYGE